MFLFTAQAHNLREVREAHSLSGPDPPNVQVHCVAWLRSVPAAVGTYSLGMGPLPADRDLSQSPFRSLCGLSHPLNAHCANFSWRGPCTGPRDCPRPASWLCLQMYSCLHHFINSICDCGFCFFPSFWHLIKRNGSSVCSFSISNLCHVFFLSERFCLLLF